MLYKAGKSALAAWREYLIGKGWRAEKNTTCSAEDSQLSCLSKAGTIVKLRHPQHHMSL